MKNEETVVTPVSIIIPVYRSEHILPVLVHEIHEMIQNTGNGFKFELILVNDHSPDNSWPVIQQLTKEYSFLVGICLMKNFGEHNAIMAGLQHGQGEIFVVMDDDLQHSPKDIPSLLAAIQAGSDVCYTQFLNNQQHPLWKRMGSWFNDKIATVLLKKPSDLYLSSFKAVHKCVMDEVIKYDGPYPYIDGLILDVTRNISTIGVQHQARYEGVGNYNLSRSVSLWFKMAINFSVLPLRIATVLGIGTAFLSVILIGLVIIEKILYPEISAGWSSLVITILFMGGLQLCALGLIGEYIGRTYLNMNKKAPYVVRSIVRATSGLKGPEVQ